MLFMLALGTTGLVAGSSFAGPSAPEIVEARTSDINGDGFIDTVTVTFDTPMDTAVPPTGFTVAGYDPRTPAAEWVCPNNNCTLLTQLRLNLTQHTTPVLGDTDAKPNISYTKPETGGAKAAVTGAPLDNVVPLEAKDGAKPALMRVIAADFGSVAANTHGIFNVQREWAQLSFSEPVKLAGAAPADRHLNLEKAVRISNGLGCQAADGDGVQIHNFPRGGSPSSDAITAPPANGSGQFIRVELKPEDGATGHAGTTPLSNAPGICKVGIDATNAGLITDLASPANAAAPEGNNRRDITIAPSSLSRIETRDIDPDPGNGAPKGDGTLDAIAVSFDQNLLDSTITESLVSQFEVKHNGAPATIVSVTSGAANDDTLIVNVTGVDWDGQTKPKVAFKGEACQLKTTVPSPTYSACAEGFGYDSAAAFVGVDAIDKIAPVFKTAQTLDGNGNGLIDGAQLAFSESLSTVTTPGWTVDDAAISGITIGSDTKTASITFAEGSGPDTGRTPAIKYAPGTGTETADGDGNEIGGGTVAAADGAAPMLFKATSFDLDANGKVDAVTLQFSEAVNEALTTPADYTIGGAATYAFGNSPIDAPGSGNDLVTVLSNSQPVYTGHIGAGYVGTTLADLASLAAPAKTIDAANVVDAAAPVATLTTTPQSPFKAGTITVKASFTEVMDTAVIPGVEVNEANVTPMADIDHENGFRKADFSKWDGAIELTLADCPDENGCNFDAVLTGGKDPSGNVTLDGATLPLNLDANEPDAATGLVMNAIQKPGFAPIAPNTVGSNTTQLSLTATIVAGQVNQLGQAAGGSAEILKGDAPLEPVARIESISAPADTVTVQTVFGSPADLQAAITEGGQTLKLKLCDGADNCSISDAITINADYTPVSVSLGSPNSGVLHGASKECVTWDADEADTTLQNVLIRYSTDGGATYPNLIANNVGPDGAGACDGAGTAYGWTVPLINANSVKVQAVTLDSFNNQSIAASAENLTIQTTYLLTHRASASVIANGAPVTISGTFKGNNVPVVGRTVTIQRKMRGQTGWQTVASVVTNSSGAYAWTGRPGMKADWRSITAAGNGYPSLTSSTSYVAVRVVLNFVTSASTLARNRFVTLSGSILPAKRGHIVQLQMISGGKWIKIGQTRSSQSGGYRFTYRLTAAGTRTFRVYYGQQDALHAGNYSVQRNVTWR